jgi:hypothetical protein
MLSSFADANISPQFEYSTGIEKDMALDIDRQSQPKWQPPCT